MSSRRRSFDQDDLSTDTNHSTNSISEVYLARIQQETHRIQKKRKDRRDSAESHDFSYEPQPTQPTTTVQTEEADSQFKGTAAAAVAERLKQKQTHQEQNEEKPIHHISLVGHCVVDSSLSISPAKQQQQQQQQQKHNNPTWNEILDSSERSNRSFEEDANSLTLKSVGSSRSSQHSRNNSTGFETLIEEEENEATAAEQQQHIQFEEGKQQQQQRSAAPLVEEYNNNNDDNDNDDPSEYSEFLVLQRGDSIAEKNHFEDPPETRILLKSGDKQNTKSSTKSNSCLSGLVSISTTGKKHQKMAANALAKEEDEAFQKKLIDEVLGKDAGDKVSMEKVMMIIWQFRDDKDVIKFMTRFVCKFAGSRDVFDGIEFYLPQLTHMMIHLETEWDDAILERFSLVIAQQSIHFALQLNWILAGAIEDYQPELPDGTPNPTYNPLYYFRCVKLLTNIERCVVYRRPRSQELQRLYEKGNITKAEMYNLEQADRRFTAMQITAPDHDDDKEIFGGTLKYKRAVRTSLFKFKRWKTRYFAIEERMLNCYNTEGGTLIRSMPLEGATIRAMKTKYPNMFAVTNRTFEFRMRASSEEDRNKWIKMLENEAKTGRVFGHTDGSLFMQNEEAQRVIEELTPSQRMRYKFYRNEREFVRRLTDIAEDLRFQEPTERKKVAPGLLKELDVPPNAYSPLMSSTDIFRRIHSTLSKDTRVFNTKARCPTVMYFLGVRGELEHKGLRHSNMDIAEYIHLKFDATSDWKSPDVKTGASQTVEDTIETADQHLSGIDEGKEETAIPSKEPQPVSRISLFTPEKQRPTDEKNSFVWSGSFSAETPGAPDTPTNKKQPSSALKGHTSPSRANRHLRKFLKESMVSVPRKLAHHLERKGNRQSSLRANSKSSGISDSSKSLAPIVPIATGRHASHSHGVGEDVYVGRSSVMDSTKIMKGKTKAGDIDQESVNRAKQIICGGETWAEKSFRMLENVENKPDDAMVQLEIVCLLSKSNDDLRQEVFVMQMIHYYKSVFIAAGIPLWLKTYKILSTSASTGLLEFMVDSTSLDGLKKSEHYPKEGGLRKYYELTYGGPDSKSFKAAQRNFVQSLAAYSIVCYLLGLKDRHNGNIMIDMRGHLVHIDYGFCMGMCVGHEFTMERAPFKLTEEYVEVMGGSDGEPYQEFKRLFVEGMAEARSKCQIALGLVEIMMYQSNYPCFSGRRYGGGQALKGFRERLMLDVPDDEVEYRARALIEKARDHWGTRAYDSFQQWSNGYAI